MRPLPAVPSARLGVFTTAEARSAGWTDEARRHALRTGRILRLNRVAFVAADGLLGTDFASRRRRQAAIAVAAGLAVRGSVVSHDSAALVAGLPTWLVPEHTCLTVAPGRDGIGRVAHLHRAALPADRIVTVADVRYTGAARTVIDIAREHGAQDAICAGDRALREHRTSRTQLDEVLAECAGWPGIRRAREVVKLLDPLSESPLESVSRLCIHQLGLPAPQLQVDIVDRSGRRIRRVDKYWDDLGVFGEADGREKYDQNGRDELWWSERRQFEALQDLGLEGVRWGKPELDDPTLLRAKLVRAFARASRRPPGPRLWRAVPTEPPALWQIAR